MHNVFLFWWSVLLSGEEFCLYHLDHKCIMSGEGWSDWVMPITVCACVIFVYDALLPQSSVLLRAHIPWHDNSLSVTTLVKWSRFFTALTDYSASFVVSVGQFEFLLFHYAFILFISSYHKKMIFYALTPTRKWVHCVSSCSEIYM